MHAPIMTRDNYRNGFLIDEELMGGISEDPSNPGHFIAFVLRHTTGEYLGYHSFNELDDALSAINSVQREWAWESTSGCGGCSAGATGKCAGTSCKKAQKTGTTPDPGCSTGACPT